MSNQYSALRLINTNKNMGVDDSKPVLKDPPRVISQKCGNISGLKRGRKRNNM
jgi:hypothetical protein